VTTGRSTREVFAIVERAGAEVIGVGSLVNRSGLDTPFAPLPSRHLLDAAFPAWPAAECPLCRDGVPIAKPGSRPIA
jgi:orotate phosphoribosyltransferase